MKPVLLTIATLSFVCTSFNCSLNAQDRVNFSLINNDAARSSNFSINLAQNTSSNPQTAEEYLQKGISQLNSKSPNLNEAKEDLDRAIELEPRLYPAYLVRGRIYDELDRPQEALADFDRAIELDPQFAQAYGDRGILYAELGRYELALNDLDRAIDEFDIQTGRNYLYRGISKLKLGSIPESKKDIEQASKLFSEQEDEAGYQLAEQILYSLESDPVLNPN